MVQDKIALNEVTIRFAGDSGDGMQLAGKKFSDEAASAGYDLNTFPDFPSEIRAPEGTLYGVSAFQIQLGGHQVTTHGDQMDVLVALNASSLKVNLPNLKDKGIIIVDISGFNSKNLKLAGYENNPLEDGTLSGYRVFKVNIEQEIKNELKDLSLPPKVVRKSKNFFALGLAYWLFNHAPEKTFEWIKNKFAKKEEVLQANTRVLKAGWNYANKHDDFDIQYEITPSKFEKGLYRNITGNHAVALGLVAAAKKANMPLFLGSYPITPATDILQYISSYKKYGVKHLQAEDEIAGITSAIGAAYGGNLAATTTSGPGLSLKIEALGLAIMTELPLVVVDVMRAGPSTGLPTKPEQSDLFQAIYGRHGEAPMPVLAASGPADCFDATVEACRIALKYMTPVMVLTDGYIAQGSEPWKIPQPEDLPDVKAHFHTDQKTFAPYLRDPDTLARAWAIPGMPGMEHRIGGLEKQDVTGHVSHDPQNHQRMVELRAEKVNRIAEEIPATKVYGPEKGNVLLISWGSTFGAVKSAWDNLKDTENEFSFVQLKYLNPLPKDLFEIMQNFDRILVPEMNMGQLKTILQGKYLMPLQGFNKVTGQPFKAAEIEEKVKSMFNN